MRTKQVFSWFALLGILSLAAAACSDGGSEGTGADAASGDAAAPYAPETTGTSDGGKDNVDAAEVAVAPSVMLENLSWTDLRAGALYGELTVNFVVANRTAAAVESVEALTISFDNGSGQALSFPIDFASAETNSETCKDWKTRPGGRSGVLEVVLSTTVSGGYRMYKLTLPCNRETSRTIGNIYSTPFYSTVQPKGPVTLRIRGLLNDGAAWSATAVGAERK